jgi:hypothetical protein
MGVAIAMNPELEVELGNRDPYWNCTRLALSYVMSSVVYLIRGWRIRIEFGVKVRTQVELEVQARYPRSLSLRVGYRRSRSLSSCQVDYIVVIEHRVDLEVWNRNRGVACS